MLNTEASLDKPCIRSLHLNGWSKRPLVLIDFSMIMRSKSDAELITEKTDIELIEGINDILLNYHRAGFSIIGLMNERGVITGEYSPNIALQLMWATRKLFDEDPFLSIEMNFTHPDAFSRTHAFDSVMTLPNIGMMSFAEKILAQHNIVPDYANSIAVGQLGQMNVFAEQLNVSFIELEGFISRGEDVLNEVKHQFAILKARDRRKSS